jgi:hypothetical protein
MDLLKNLLFMSATPTSFSKLKDTWKAITDEIHLAREKPLRFLRYYLMASYEVEAGLREDDIYDWFRGHEDQTKHARNPVGFADRLLGAAKAYRSFVECKNVAGQRELGIANTRLLGGKAIRQHFILLLAARELPSSVFSALANEIEKLMFVWLATNTPAKDYERAIMDGARQLRTIKTAAEFEVFSGDFFGEQKRVRAALFRDTLLRVHSYDMRGFRLKYLLAKITQYVDVDAYGATGARADLSHYTDGGNDIEHIFPDTPSSEALREFGEVSADGELIQRLGNLLLVEKSVNRALGNKPYSEKLEAYRSSQFLLVRCQAAH